ncbi:cupin domain-containing protein [Acidithiobacillus sp.]|uniref:JmjC domain-containing protein n=1 Tax=Acidithiobacillus sp. TaxID=1872118 RepID=UPI0025BDDCCC|nr:cupin domain-containing protein [Acidithiobacillus sp.]MCK9189195.1 cupin domain-containing protein [Acidithiobacillus sp.]MCK9359637.1 cupin domain-containing protein [Acidithiobacillus sp.]
MEKNTAFIKARVVLKNFSKQHRSTFNNLQWISIRFCNSFNSVHFDAIDMFAIQLDGTKNWKVFPQLVVMPTAIQGRKVSEEEVGDTLAEYLLEPGDVLYLPAGTLHSANCTNKHSTHITIGLAPWRANQVAEYIINTLLAPTSETMRQHLFPSAVDEHTESKLKIALIDIASSLERIDTNYAIKSFISSVNAASVGQ